MSEAAAESGEGETAPVRARTALPSAVGFVLTIAVVWLGGQYLTQGVSDELVASRPALAVLWRGDSADALAALAHKDLGRNSGGAVRLSLKALQHAPLDTLALTTYGLAEARLGHRALADRAIALSGSRGWRDVLTQIWLFRSLLMQARLDAAFRHADALMRREDVNPPVLYRILAVAARDPPALDPLAARLAADPSWRQPFFASLATDPSPLSLGVYRALLERLAKGPTPPTSGEVGLYLSRLVSEQDYA
ncbi:MAG: hypothetical protein ACREEQ_04820, partial [Caulobacteraceae bacterium]